jgi:hypothetical protein
MFRRFLDTADYWFGCSDDSNIGSYDPARECFVVAIDEHADGADGAGDGDAPQDLESNPPPTPPVGHADITAQQAQARELKAKLAEKYRQVRLLRATIAGNPRRAANAFERQEGRPVSASTPTSTSTIHTRHLKPAKSSSRQQH